jgi:hypothetical protein
VAAGTAGTAAAAGTGAAEALGPAAAAVKTSVNRTVTRMSKVNNPIFFKCSSSSDFRLGRNRCNFVCKTSLMLRRRAETPAQYSRTDAVYTVQKITLRMLHLVLVPASPPQERCRQHEENHDRDIDPFYLALQPLPMLAEQITRAGNHRHP